MEPVLFNDPEFPRIGLGCMGMNEFYGPTDDTKSHDILMAAYDMGYRLFDTADMYGFGRNESLIGTFLKRLGEIRALVKKHASASAFTSGIAVSNFGDTTP